MNKPVGVAGYRLTGALPPELKDQLPSAEAFRSAIRKKAMNEEGS